MSKPGSDAKVAKQRNAVMDDSDCLLLGGVLDDTMVSKYIGSSHQSNILKDEDMASLTRHPPSRNIQCLSRKSRSMASPSRCSFGQSF